jgi:hypothetical protein
MTNRCDSPACELGQPPLLLPLLGALPLPEEPLPALPPLTEAGKPHALKSAATSLQLVEGSATVVPVVLPPPPVPVLHTHVPPGSVHVTVYSTPLTVSEHPHCVSVEPSGPPPPPPKQLVGAPASALSGGDGGTPCEKQLIVPSDPVAQQRSGSPSGDCHPGGHASHVVVEGCSGQTQGGQAGQTPLSGSHAGHEQAQALPPELPAPEELPRVPPPPLQKPLPSDSVWQQVVSTVPPELLPLLPAPPDSGGEYQPTGHA